MFPQNKLSQALHILAHTDTHPEHIHTVSLDDWQTMPNPSSASEQPPENVQKAPRLVTSTTLMEALCKALSFPQVEDKE